MRLAHREGVKWRLGVVVGLVAMATGRCWAGGVQPSAGPRFGVEGKRHRMVLPLSAFPSSSPLLHRAVWSVDVALDGLTSDEPEAQRTYAGAARAPGIRDVIVRAGGVTLQTRRPVEEARAFLLSDPPRLVVDVYAEDGERGGDWEQGPGRSGGSETVSAGGPSTVYPRTTPRFGLHEGRLRFVVPLSGFPATHPSIHPAVWTVDVMLGDLGPTAATAHVPAPDSATAQAIHDAVIRPGGVTLHANRPVRYAHAFLLREPPRLVVDLAADEGFPSGDQDGARGWERHQGARHGAPTPAERQHIAEAQPGEGSEEPVNPLTNFGGGTRGVDGMGVPPAGARIAAVAGPGEASVADSSPEKRPRPPEPAEESVAVSRDHVSNDAQPGAPALASTEQAEAPTYRVEEFRGLPMIWPDLTAPSYAQRDGPAAAEALVDVRREAVADIRHGRSLPTALGPPDAAGAVPTFSRQPLPRQAPAPAHYLEADLAYLRAAAGKDEAFSAAALYRRAVRLGPQFADRDRGQLMTAFAELAAGLAPEAEGEFLRLARATRRPSVAALALWAAGRAARTAGNTGRAARHLRHAIATDRRSHGACRSRGTLAVILAETKRAADGLALLEEMQGVCGAEVIRAPGTLLNHAGVLAAAGRLQEAEQLLLALPDFEGETFARRMFLEADLAIAAGTPGFARKAYEKIRSQTDLPEMVRAEATLRLAELEDQTEHWDRARTLLQQLASTARSMALRARPRALEAEFLAQRDLYPEALHILQGVDALGPPGLLAAERSRKKIFRRWMDQLAARGNDAEILTVFYRYRGDGIGGHLRPTDLVRVASAAVAAGLPDLAIQILSPVQERLTGSARRTARRIAAEAALAKGESAHALRLSANLARAARSAEERALVNRLRAKALLHLGRTEEASTLIETLGAPADLIALGRAYLQDETMADKALAVLQRALASTDERSAGQSTELVQGWFALADAAERAGKHAVAASALRAAIQARGDTPTPGARYQLADTEAIGMGAERAAATYARAAEQETDPLFARAAAASAAYHAALQAAGGAL